MEKLVLPPRDELLEGDSKTWSAYLPVRLVDALKRAAAIDGFRSVGAYAATLLVYALRQREAERLKEQMGRNR